MQTVIVVIHLLIVITLVGVVLIQRSEGGGLGIGGGSGFMTERGAKNALTRLTAILAACFFITSLILVIFSSISNPTSDILNRIPTINSQGNGNSALPADPNDIINQLGGPTQSTTSGQSTKPEPSKPAANSENPVPQPSENPIPGE